MSKLISHYESRIKNFVIKMSENPYIIKKYHGIYSQKKHSPINITQTFYQKNAFSFKKYKSDKERINEILEKNAVLEDYYKKMNAEKERLKKLYQIKFAPKLIQPNMHFQSKGGDSIVNKKLAKKIKELTKKSKSVDNYIMEEANEDNENIQNKTSIINKNKNNNNYNLNDYNLTEEQIRKRNLHNKIIEDRKSMINARKLLMNLEGLNIVKKNNSNNNKYILDEDFRKTEFKAMENLKIFKTSTMNKYILKKWEKEDQENQINIKLNNLLNLNLTESNNRKANNFNKSLTRNNKSNTEFFTTKKTYDKKNNNNQKLKKMYSVDEFDLNNTNSDISSNMDNNNLYNFNSNIIKEKPYIENRRQKLSEDKKILNNFKITNIISKNNPLLYKLYFSDTKSKKDNIGINEEQFNQIKKMAFNEKKENVNISTNDNDKLEEENNEELNIYNKKYKKLSVDKLAEKILTDTNWNLKNNYKSKYGLMNKG